MENPEFHGKGILITPGTKEELITLLKEAIKVIREERWGTAHMYVANSLYALERKEQTGEF